MSDVNEVQERLVAAADLFTAHGDGTVDCLAETLSSSTYLGLTPSSNRFTRKFYLSILRIMKQGKSKVYYRIHPPSTSTIFLRVKRELTCTVTYNGLAALYI